MKNGYQLPIDKELNEKEFREAIETLGCVPWRLYTDSCRGDTKALPTCQAIMDSLPILRYCDKLAAIFRITRSSQKGSNGVMHLSADGKQRLQAGLCTLKW
ncbi:hypothetical protein J3459_018189 [Metarhizium acridum]|nr:hypothetical protein J3459_018189 [Metarhizium acridum]